MSVFESLHRGRARRKGRAGPLLVGAWVIFFAASVLPPGCLVYPAAAHALERNLGEVAGGAVGALHEGSPSRAACCQEVRPASLDFDVWAAPSVDRPGSKPFAPPRSAKIPFAAENVAAAGVTPLIPRASPVPTYLLTLRLRA